MKDQNEIARETRLAMATSTSSSLMKQGRKKQSLGRQKIPIKRIQKEEARQVCFSKRRAGLFKKAHELSVLCGAHLAVVVFSPANKPFSFGHPSVHHVIDRYLAPESYITTHFPVQTQHNMPPSHDTTSELNMELVKLTAQLEASRNRKEKLESELESKKGSIWSADLEKLGLAELETVKAGLERIWNELEINKERLMMEAGFFPNSCGYREGFGYGFENYGYGLVDQKVHPLLLSAAQMNMAVPQVIPEALFPGFPDMSYPDLGLY